MGSFFLVRERTRDAQILLHYLGAYDRMGVEIERLDEEDRRASLDFELDDSPTARKAIEAAGSQGDEQTLRYLLRRSHRSAALWATLLDRRPRTNATDGG